MKREGQRSKERLKKCEWPNAEIKIGWWSEIAMEGGGPVRVSDRRTDREDKIDLVRES